MTDYAAIADAATGMTAAEAFAAMSVEKTSYYRPLTGNDLRIWSAMNTTDYELLENGTDTFSKLAMKLVNSSTSVLDVSDVRVQGFIGALPISEAGKTDLYNMAQQEKLVWPGLKPGQVITALEKRAVGEV